MYFFHLTCSIVFNVQVGVILVGIFVIQMSPTGSSVEAAEYFFFFLFFFFGMMIFNIFIDLIA